MRELQAVAVAYFDLMSEKIIAGGAELHSQIPIEEDMHQKEVSPAGGLIARSRMNLVKMPMRQALKLDHRRLIR